MPALIGPLLLKHSYEMHYYHVPVLCQIHFAIIVHICYQISWHVEQSVGSSHSKALSKLHWNVHG